MSETCTLCGLQLRRRTRHLPGPDGPLPFCCQGCRMVYTMLAEAGEEQDPAGFRASALFRELQAAGVIPASADDLAGRSGETDDPPAPPPETDPARGLPLDLRVSGMWCPACAWVISRSLEKRPGVYAARCNFSSDRLHLRYDPVATGPTEIADAVARLGYTAGPADAPAAGTGRREFLRLIVSALFTVNVMMLSFALYAGFFTDLGSAAQRNLGWPAFAMASVVFFYGGRPVFRRAASGLRAGAPGMEALIAIGSSTAFGYSVFNLLTGSIHLYFDTASMLITLVLLGKAIEARAREAVTADLGTIRNMRPAKVRICDATGGSGRYVAAEHLRPGDLFRVTAGERSAADGTVVDGRAVVDEAAVTGEPRPLEIRPGDRLRSGARVLDGELRVRAGAVGGQSTLGQMITVMEAALDRRTPGETAAERILLVFVPLVVLLAASTGLACRLAGLPMPEAVIRAVTVLVISCPCALGIAIPLARVAGISLAARRGIVVRDTAVFEAPRTPDAVVLDKTGTVTVGTWELRELRLTGSLDRETVLALAAGMERGADHPVAAGIRREARRAGVRPRPVDDPQPSAGGLRARCDGVAVRIGAAGPAAAGTATVSATGDPLSRVALWYDGRQCAVFVFGDRMHPAAAAAVRSLLTDGRRLVMVSGDGPDATRAAADRLGIAEARGGMRPQEKAEFVSGLRAAGLRTAMVGDGVNDAPALAAADLAVAVHAGHDLEREAAHATLMGGSISGLPDLLDLAGRVRRTIRQNLAFSLAYNLVAIPVAMAGMLTPPVAVAAMLGSSLSVTANTLRLIREERRRTEGDRKNRRTSKIEHRTTKVE